jgi:hypothetical protein
MATDYLVTRDQAQPFELFGTIHGHSYQGAHPWTSGEVVYLEMVRGECTGEFAVGQERFGVKPTDVVRIPKETPFGYRGTMKYLLFMTPSFVQGCETRTEQSAFD